ncbi:unnamed protein product [Amoebophrya sp. A25]|nr:unnamed protein product [Amoebophrya sp. A25]|eukprot:GSA25T00018056001.1
MNNLVRELDLDGNGGGSGAIRSTSTASKDFQNLVEHTIEAFCRPSETSGAPEAVKDVHQINCEVRQDFDDVAHQTAAKARELAQLRNQLRLLDLEYKWVLDKEREQQQLARTELADLASPRAASSRTEIEPYHPSSSSSYSKFPVDPSGMSVSEKISFLRGEIESTTVQHKVYAHMKTRLEKELLILTEKNGILERHLQRKKRECDKRKEEVRKVEQCRETEVVALFERTKADAQKEFTLKQQAAQAMFRTLQDKKNTLKRRLDFQRWRRDLALEAGSESFHFRAGRLRKLWALEKLQGNYLQKVIFSQVEKSQETEEGFQKIRELTGLTDVMEIVHRLLDRDIDQVQLKSAVQDAETRLEHLREEHARFKNDTEDLTSRGFSSKEDGMEMATYREVGQQRNLYEELIKKDTELRGWFKRHAVARTKLAEVHRTVEHLRSFMFRICKSLPLKLTLPDGTVKSVFTQNDLMNPSELLKCYRVLSGVVEQFLRSVLADNTSKEQKFQRIAYAKAKAYHEQLKLLNDKEFLRCNVRSTNHAINTNHAIAQDSRDEDNEFLVREREVRKRAGRLAADQLTRAAHKAGGGGHSCSVDPLLLTTQTPRSRTGVKNKMLSSSTAGPSHRTPKHLVGAGDHDTREKPSKRISSTKISRDVEKYLLGEGLYAAWRPGGSTADDSLHLSGTGGDSTRGGHMVGAGNTSSSAYNVQHGGAPSGTETTGLGAWLNRNFTKGKDGAREEQPASRTENSVNVPPGALQPAAAPLANPSPNLRRRQNRRT